MSRVVVTGAGGILGRAVARRLEADGAELVLADVGDVDLTDEAATQAWADALGDVDAVVHCVGGWRGGATIEDTPREDIAFLDAALVETLRTTSRAFAPALKRSEGRFLIVSGSTAQQPPAGNAAYAAAKAYAEAWTLAFDRELRDHGAAANILVVTMLTEDRPGPKVATHVDDAAEAIAFALSPAARAMRGRRLPLHG